MIAAVWSALGAKGFLLALAIAAGIVTSAYGLGQMHGYARYGQKAESVKEAALRDQRAQDQKDHEREMALALNKQRAKYEQQSRIRQVVRPNTSCELPPDCLRWADDILGAATADIPRADPTPPG